MRAICMIGLWLVSAGGAMAADGAVTDLVTGRCTVIARETKDEAGEPLKKSEQYASAWRCAGHQGRYVYVRYGDQREEIAFGSRRGVTTGYLGHGHFGSWGPTVEWRGTAAIVQYRWDIRDGEEAGKRDVGGDLAVIRLGQGRKDTCIVAWVDTIANADAIDLARKAADSQVAGHVCSEARKPDYLGKRRPGAN